MAGVKTDGVRSRGGWGTAERPGRFGLLFAAIWLVFLIDTLRVAWDLAWGDRQVAGWVGLLATVAFAGVYLAIFAWVRGQRLRRLEVSGPLWRRLSAVVALVVLMGVMVGTLGQVGLSAVVYLTVVLVLMLPTRAAMAALVLIAIGVDLSGRVVPGWEEQAGLTIAVLTSGFAMWGISQLMSRNLQLLVAEEENSRLAVSDERNRFARDLHDILGHSLTVITVKAELARKLADVDLDRTKAELADLERLSRDALADVRRAVDGYRELTLPGELARARTALAAAEIAADLPNSTEAVPSDKRELFAWTIREGITNVLRHSGATRCTVVLDTDRVEIRDDGQGPNGATSGNGLTGLRERAGAQGATVVTQALEPGFSLAVVSS